MPRATEKINWVITEKVDRGPFATFYFKYRSLHALQTLGIIPREPTPVPLEDRPGEDLSAEEFRELVKRLEDDKVAATKVKKEHAKKRKRTISINDGSDATDDFEIVEARNKRHRNQDANGVIVLD
ncbi:hypothetical protein SLS59_007429 [Nothophoma quercina]|uniref:DUF7918 domain-containing protein n=1 Tax=Nothophoma quercina TaxID=749835 RepID=A0ABR3QZ11_9PLEO